MRILGENEKPLTREEIEQQKKLVNGIYKKEKEDRDVYLKNTEEERKKSFEEGKEHISDLIDEKAFRIDRQKETVSQLKELKPDIVGTSEKIEKSIGEKAFRVEKQRELDEQRSEMHPDIEGSAEKIEKSIGEKAFRVEKQRE